MVDGGTSSKHDGVLTGQDYCLPESYCKIFRRDTVGNSTIRLMN
jgi:hypothetical protein